MKRSLEILILASICLSLGAGAVLAQGRSGKGHSRGTSGMSVERMQRSPAESQQRSNAAAKDREAQRGKEKSNAGREKLSKEEREALREAEGPGAMGRLRRFFGWERSQERMSEQGREHQRATEQQRGPGDRPED